jgi:hypothetical protein
MSLRKLRGIPRMGVSMCTYAISVGIISSAMKKSPRLTRQEKLSWRQSGL